MKRNSRSRGRIAAVAAVLVLALAAAQDARARGMIQGHVVDREGNPVSDVELVLRPAKDASLRTTTVRTDKKGAYFFQADNGDYNVVLDAGSSRAIERIRIDARDDKGKPVYNWEGKVAPGTPPANIGVSSGLKIVIDLVVEDGAVLRREHAAVLLATVQKALQDGNRDKARSTVESLLEFTPGDPVGLMLRGYIAAEDGRDADAERDFRQAIEADPKLADAHYQLGLLNRKSDRAEEALGHFRTVTEVTEDAALRARAWLNIGELERAAGRDDKALEAFLTAVQAAPEFEGPVAPEVARLFQKAGDRAKADEWVAKATAAGNADAKVLYNLAVDDFNRKEWQKATDGFRKVIATDPAFAPAYRNLGYALMNLGAIDESVTHLKKYLELSPSASDAMDVQEVLKSLRR